MLHPFRRHCLPGRIFLRFFGAALDNAVSTVYNDDIQLGVNEMYVLIDNKNGIPIYAQIYTQIKNQIIAGELTSDEMLPSIRGLAKDLRISFITTKRAYDELEKDGFIYTLQGKGCYVAPKNTELLREEHLKKIEMHMEQILQLAATCNLTRDELMGMMTLMMEESV
jgi:GntR family transcriptional regulator